MATINKYRQKYLRYHASYEKRATKELLKVFKSWGKRIQLQGDDFNGWVSQVNSFTPIDDLMTAYLTIYTNIGKVHGSRVLRDIDKETKMFGFGEFVEVFRTAVGLYLQREGLKRVVLVRQSFIDEIVKIISQRNEMGWSVARITDAVQEQVKQPNFYRWQAARIARTESTAASNFSAMQVGSRTGFMMQKVWVSASDGRTRRKPDDEFDHFEMNGKKVDVDQPFKLTSNKGVEDLVQFPGDPTGDAGNIINCRCAIAMVPKKDRNGRLIRF